MASSLGFTTEQYATLSGTSVLANFPSSTCQQITSNSVPVHPDSVQARLREIPSLTYLLVWARILPSYRGLLLDVYRHFQCPMLSRRLKRAVRLVRLCHGERYLG